MVRTENKESDVDSSSDEDQNHVESATSATIVPEVSSKEPLALKNLTFTPETHVFPINPKTSLGPSPPRPSRIPVLQEPPDQAIDVKQMSYTAKGKTKVQSKLDKAIQLVERGLPSSSEKCIQGCED